MSLSTCPSNRFPLENASYYVVTFHGFAEKMIKIYLVNFTVYIFRDRKFCQIAEILPKKSIFLPFTK